jgi:glycosyltransferase involved in cell wall biosynthesis
VLRLENWGFRTVLNRLLGNRPFVLLNNHPNFYWKGLLAGLMRDATLSVYDLSDDFLEFHSVQAHREVIGRSLEYSCRGSDLVLAVNQHVADRYRKYNENTHVVLNATNTENFLRESFAEIPQLADIRRQAQAVFGYAGIINRVRLDYDLVRTTAEARPDWHFMFLGSADPSFLEMVADHPNLHYHPAVSYRELPDWLHGFDAIVVPFERNAHTQGNDLLKVNDGLAMGKPVVVAGVECLERYGDLIRVAHGPEEFVQALEAARNDYDPAEVERRRAFARANSWTRRTAAVHALLVEQLRAKLEGVRAE